MQKDRLKAYVDNELATAKQLLTDVAAASGGPKANLRLLYGVPRDAKVVYAESGGLSNVAYFPEDTTIIIPVFPWSEDDLFATVGPLSQLRSMIEAGRVFPIIQHPLYYEDCDHLEFLFGRSTPSYFVRGLFAYSAVLGIPPEVEFNEAGIPLLAEISRLMSHCDRVHQSWLGHVKGKAECWEYRYRNQSIRDERFYKRLHRSLCYRYASVALCIGQHNADELVAVFPHKQSSSILLHLHILFDHVICHGVGSDFVVRPQTPDGMDFRSSKRTGVTHPHEFNLADDLSIALPEEQDDYVRCLLREEHFLREIDFSLLTPESVPEFQSQLSHQFGEFGRKVESISKGKKLTEVSVQITLYVLSTAAMLVGVPLGGAAGIIASLKVPWLADAVAKTLKKTLRNKLASYTFESQNRERG